MVSGNFGLYCGCKLWHTFCDQILWATKEWEVIGINVVRIFAYIGIGILETLGEKDMAFKLSQRSLDRLVGVHPHLVEVVKKAIEYTDVDFGVIYGVRDLETQKKLYESGKSQTMASKHLIQEDGYAHAVDLMAYDGSNPSWDIVDYDNIADAMRKAGKEVGVDLVWGAAWHKLLNYVTG